MTVSGWTGEAPEAEGAGMPLTGQLLSLRERRASPLEDALARSRAADAREALEAAASASDPDERAANLVARGVMPGMLSDLSQRLGDTLAELAAEEEKIERGERRQEQMRRAHERGQVTALDIARMDFDEGDPVKVQRLERRAGSLRRQLQDASELMAPARAPADPLGAATRHAHEVFVETTRARMAEARERRATTPLARPPFFAGRGGVAVRSEQPVTCPECIALGATAEESYLIHNDPDPVQDGDAEMAQFARETGQRFRPAAGAGRSSWSGYVSRAVDGAIVAVR